MSPEVWSNIGEIVAILGSVLKISFDMGRMRSDLNGAARLLQEHHADIKKLNAFRARTES